MDQTPKPKGEQPGPGEDSLSFLTSETSSRGTPAAKPAAPKTTTPTWLPWAIAGAAVAIAGVIAAVAFLLPHGPIPAPVESSMAKPSPSKVAKPQAAPQPVKPATIVDENTVLVIDWPEAERGGGTVAIDGREVPLVALGEVKYTLRARPAPYKVALSRPGYDKIEFEHAADAGRPPEPFRPQWKKGGDPAVAAHHERPTPPNPDAVATDGSREKGTTMPPVSPGGRKPPAGSYVLVGWLQDFEKAKEIASEQEKAVLLVFIDSDGSPPCRQLVEEVLTKPEFNERTDKDFVRVLIDLPKGPEARSRVKDADRKIALARQFEVRALPTILLTDSQGKPTARRLGTMPGGVSAFSAWIEQEGRPQLAEREPPKAAKPPESPLPEVPPKRPDDVAADEFLRQHGLVKSGNLWVLDDEKAIQQKVIQIASIRKELARRQNVAKTAEQKRHAADKTSDEAKAQVDSMVRQYNTVGVVTTPQLAALNSAKGRHEEARRASEQARQAAGEARAGLNSTIESLAAEVASLREKYDRAKRVYAALSGAPAIRKSIADANEGAEKQASLGPTESFRALDRRIGELATLVAGMSGRAPIRQRGKLWYVEVDLNGKKKLEMAIDTGAEIICLPWKAASEAGLNPDQGTPALVQVADGSTARAMRLTIPVVRVGQFSARNVECTVLPAEAGDVTPLLGQTFLSRFSYRIDAADRTLVLSGSSDSEKSEGRGTK